jgi:hypothetical protein
MERRSCNDRLKPPPLGGQFSGAVDMPDGDVAATSAASRDPEYGLAG